MVHWYSKHHNTAQRGRVLVNNSRNWKTGHEGVRSRSTLEIGQMSQDLEDSVLVRVVSRLLRRKRLQCMLVLGPVCLVVVEREREREQRAFGSRQGPWRSRGMLKVRPRLGAGA